MSNYRSLGWLVLAFLALVSAVFVNLAVNKTDLQFDLTEDRRYTLPEAAHRILDGLEDDVIARIYLSADLPAELAHVPRALEDRLGAMRKASGGRLYYEFKDPTDDVDLEADLEARGIKKLATVKDGQASSETYWVCATLSYRDRQEREVLNFGELGEKLRDRKEFYAILPFVFCRAILRATGEEATVGIVGRERSLVLFSDDFELPLQIADLRPSDLLTDLERRFASVPSISLRGGSVRVEERGRLLPAPEGLRTLLVPRPQELTKEEVFALDQFLLGGGRVILLVDDHEALVAPPRAPIAPQTAEQVSKLPQQQLQTLRQRWSQQVTQNAGLALCGAVHGNEMPLRKVKNPVLRSWLRHFGIKLGEGVVEDRSNHELSFVKLEVRNRQLAPRAMQPPVPAILRIEEQRRGQPTGQFSSSLPVLGGLGSAAMIWPVPMELAGEGAGEATPTSEQLGAAPGQEVRLEALMWTSPEAWVREVPAAEKEGDPSKLGLYEKAPPAAKEWRRYPLIAFSSGRYRTFFRAPAEEVPADDETTEGEQEKPEEDPRAAPAGLPFVEHSTKEGQLWVLADSDFALRAWEQALARDQLISPRFRNPFLRRQNPQVVQSLKNTNRALTNIVEFATYGTDLIDLRTPVYRDRSLDGEALRVDRGYLRTWAVFAPPLVLLWLGLIRWGIRAMQTASKRGRPRLTAGQGRTREGEVSAAPEEKSEEETA